MKKLENKNFGLSATEFIGTLVFICLMAASVWFCKSYRDVKELFNIEKTEVDFIIQAPSAKQISELEALNHIDRAVPYYFRSVDVSKGKKNTASNLFIIENAEDIGYTIFSDKLLLNRCDAADNPLYVTDDFSKSIGVKIEDPIDIAVDGTIVRFTVAGIYKSDYRNVGGSLLAIMAGDVKNAMKTSRYSGAYIASNNLTETGKYLENEYIPMGDLRDRAEFESDEAYQIYLDTRGQSDSTMAAFVKADYVKELSKRNEDKMLRSMILMIVMFVIAYMIVMVIVSVRASGYIKKNVLRDVRDNFTVDQELKMYSMYFVGVTAILLMVNIAVACFGYVTGWMQIVSPINVAGVVLSVLLVALCGHFQKNRLKESFLIEKKYEEEMGNK